MGEAKAGPVDMFPPASLSKARWILSLEQMWFLWVYLEVIYTHKQTCYRWHFRICGLNISLQHNVLHAVLFHLMNYFGSPM